MVTQRYARAYPGIFEGVDGVTAYRVVQVLGSTPDGSLWPRQEVSDLVDRMSGRITFEQYLARGRHRTGSGSLPDGDREPEVAAGDGGGGDRGDPSAVEPEARAPVLEVGWGDGLQRFDPGVAGGHGAR